MKKIEREFDKVAYKIDLDYVEKFILANLKKAGKSGSTASAMVGDLNVSMGYFMQEANFLAETRKSFFVEFQCGLDNMYLR